jgi:5-formyltetrahydrofolate cyclo-ligase
MGMGRQKMMISGALQEAKQRLRRDMLGKRRSLSAAEKAVRSEQIAKWFCSWPIYQASGTIMLYLAMPDEPQTELLIQDAVRRGKRVCVPLLGKSYGEMAAAEITSLDDLVIGKLGLKMPDPDKAKLVLAEDIELVVVPAVAFDREGNRLGMGAGYYDRFLEQNHDSVLLGITWTCQLADSLPYEEHDVRMQYLLTEEGFLSCGQAVGEQNAGKKTEG